MGGQSPRGGLRLIADSACAIQLRNGGYHCLLRVSFIIVIIIIITIITIIKVSL